ncbi:hypothetical protein KSF73_02760 [Burkholderiaceae bacterium DAT-1]|nr:hypothetical protein [Burkholderiaceae bacterium DAT-1]
MTLRSKSKQSGAVLLEALISVVLFLVGLIALISVQSRAASISAQGKYRAEAAYLANQALGIMRAQLPGNPGTPLGNYVCSPCTSANNTAGMLSTWGPTVASTLPSGVASIAVAGSLVTITITWQAPNDSQHNFTISSNVYN